MLIEIPKEHHLFEIQIFGVSNFFFLNPEKCNVSRFTHKYCVAQLFLTLIVIRNVS